MQRKLNNKSFLISVRVWQPSDELLIMIYYIGEMQNAFEMFSIRDCSSSLVSIVYFVLNIIEISTEMEANSKMFLQNIKKDIT